MVKTQMIGDLPGLGPKSQAMLAQAGIHCVADLQRMGAIDAYIHAKRANPNISLNLLWGLESALSDLPWQEVARRHRTSLLLALEEREKTLVASIDCASTQATKPQTRLESQSKRRRRRGE